MTPSLRTELRAMRTHTWLTRNPFKRLKALLVVHQVFVTSRGIMKELEAGKRIRAWNQGMGANAPWENCT